MDQPRCGIQYEQACLPPIKGCYRRGLPGLTITSADPSDAAYIRVRDTELFK